MGFEYVIGSYDLKPCSYPVLVMIVSFLEEGAKQFW